MNGRGSIVCVVFGVVFVAEVVNEIPRIVSPLQHGLGVEDMLTATSTAGDTGDVYR